MSLGYVDTSYASQGKTVDRVFITTGNESIPAANQQQWYVSASRGREMAKVYVDSKEDVRNAIVEAEQMADVEIRSVYLGVTGSHLRGFNNRGVHPVVSADREISEDDAQDVIKNAKTINLPAQNHVVHAIRQHFLVDGQDGITNPVGMLGARVEVDVHVVHGNLNRLQNAIRTVKGLQLEVDDIVFNGLASSLALLSNEQKELGSLVIDIGGGTTEVALISLSGIVFSRSVRVAGDELDEAIVQYMKRAYNLMVGERTAEEIKIKIGSAYPTDKETSVEVKGRDLVAGLPKTLQITSQEVREALLEPISTIVDSVRITLERCPPELSADLVDRGLVLAGGGALLRGFDKLLSEETGLPVHVAEDPLSAVAEGTGKCLNELKFLRQVASADRQWRQ
jgi:rod shape-determining protein MreB